MSEKQSDIVARLRDPMREVDFGDRLMAADEIERLRAALQRDILADSKTTKNAPVLENVTGHQASRPHRARGHFKDNRVRACRR
jgi:hypothetical protein